jgi:hypothetical protein
MKLLTSWERWQKSSGLYKRIRLKRDAGRIRMDFLTVFLGEGL